MKVDNHLIMFHYRNKQHSIKIPVTEENIIWINHDSGNALFDICYNKKKGKIKVYDLAKSEPLESPIVELDV